MVAESDVGQRLVGASKAAADQFSFVIGYNFVNIHQFNPAWPEDYVGCTGEAGSQAY